MVLCVMDKLRDYKLAGAYQEKSCQCQQGRWKQEDSAKVVQFSLVTNPFTALNEIGAKTFCLLDPRYLGRTD